MKRIKSKGKAMMADLCTMPFIFSLRIDCSLSLFSPLLSRCATDAA